MTQPPTQSHPRVSVLMSLYREKPSEAREAIESILRQSFSHIELIIVVDDPSNEELRHIADSYAEDDMRVRVIVQPKPLGLAVGRNTGIDAAKGEYIAMMDGDDIARPNRLEKQLAWIESHGCDLVFSHMEYISETGDTIGSFTPYLGANSVTGSLFKGQIFGHPTALIRATVFEQLRYDPAFIKGQDVDLWLRCARGGFRFCIIPEQLLRCRLHRGASLEERFQRQLGYGKYGSKIVRKHFKHYWKQWGFWNFARQKVGYYFFLTLTPKPLLKAIARHRDQKRSSS